MALETLHIIIVLILLFAVFFAFVKELLPPDVVALSAFAILLATGVLNTNEALSVFNNPGPITVGAMFILSAALERTGCIDAMGRFVTRIGAKAPVFSVFALMLLVMFASAFMNNTPVVVLMIPVVFSLAKVIGLSASQLLIPLSFAAILGGMTTLIGTSTNLLADGIVRAYSLPAFGVFEITPAALCMALVGFLYMIFIGRYLLPSSLPSSEFDLEGDEHHFLMELLIVEGSSYIGKTLEEAGFIHDGRRVLDVVRADTSLRKYLDSLRLAAGDYVVLETSVKDFLDLREGGNVAVKGDVDKDYKKISTKETVIRQGIIGPRSRFVGRKIGAFNLRRRYGIYILAIHRQNTQFKKNLDDIRLEFGDMVLFEGPEEGINRLFETNQLINLRQPRIEPYRRGKAWFALFVLFMVMLFSSLGVMPIVNLALIGAVAVIAFGCLAPRDAYRAVEWRILALIFGMLTLSIAMQKTGVIQLFVDAVMPFLITMPPLLVLALIYLMANLLTEMISNNAVAVLLTPIVIVLAGQLGVDARPFIVAVMFGANASFATPIGYQTNMLVYGAGGYKFKHFVKVGLPLNLLLWGTAIFVIPIFWSF